MKVIERLSLIDRIGRELQSRMSYGEIDTYLKAHGVDIKKPTSGVNSKWVYSKELLADESEDLIIRIADELEVPHNHVVADSTKTLEATFWEPFHFKLFLSHLSSFKSTTGQLQAALRKYGISAFVAHVDIEPTREWMDEIEAGLYSMDALAAILMPGFKESNWTDQEVGIAVGRGTLVIPIMRGLEPYGFISKYQGLNATGKTVAAVAEEIFRILTSSPKTRAKMLSCLTETTLQAKSEVEVLEKLGFLASVKALPKGNLQQLQEAAANSVVLMAAKPLEKLNELLASHKLSPVFFKKSVFDFDDDIPF
ncbi:toll/interleukin-1 receptor domain-containing protein [Ferribacterium limneticum]|uniref:toll/interleukin-1 receptor domain-containing protein n=1 Tax=Ferribacterium limneticum TaxID=76259 RepID=UPI001CFAEA6A|nr:toll/interleukin-1 receptor domain-containing protein [Ferribacterium limneticum]UCV20263.1 toll/interleukin-1 receptor domain-containing protein [Ferribacterium limneticum]